MVRFKHRYLVATVASGPGQRAEVEAKEILAMLKVKVLLPPAPAPPIASRTRREHLYQGVY